MKDMIQRMTDLENTAKQELTESAVSECGAMPAEPMDRGSPVSINVSLNATGKEHVADLIDMMKHAGLGGAEEVKPAMMPMRTDMEKFRSMVDGPKQLPAPEEMEMDTDEGWKGSAAGSITGGVLGGPLGSIAGGIVGDKLGDMFDDDEDEDEADESYDNSPDEKYQDTKFMTKDLSGGLNREKKSYKAAQQGDNAMAIEELIKELKAEYDAKVNEFDVNTYKQAQAKKKKVTSDGNTNYVDGQAVGPVSDPDGGSATPTPPKKKN